MMLQPNSFGVESLEGRRLLSGNLPPVQIPLFNKTLLIPNFSGTPNAGPVTRQGPVNGDFSKTPDFTGWQTAGNEFVQAADFHPIPDGKAAQAVISNAQQPNGGTLPTSADNLETFLGLTSGALSAPGKTAVNGSAIKQNITAKRGDVLTFKADFLTNEIAKGNADYAFVTITLNGKTQLFKLARDLKATNPLDGSGFTSETGYGKYVIFLPKSGQYTLGFGVVNVGDGTVASDLLVDNVQLQPHFFDEFDGFGGRREHNADDNSTDDPDVKRVFDNG